MSRESLEVRILCPIFHSLKLEVRILLEEDAEGMLQAGHRPSFTRFSGL